MDSSKPVLSNRWVWYGHVSTVFTFFLGILAWTMLDPQVRLILAALAGICQIASIICYKLNLRQRVIALESNPNRTQDIGLGAEQSGE